MIFGGQSLERSHLLIHRAAVDFGFNTAYEIFDPLGDFIYIVNICALGDVDIDVNTLGINFREELHRLFQADYDQPPLKHQNEHAEGNADNGERHAQGPG